MTDEEDVIVVKSRADLKKLAEQNTSPCAKCVQSEGCPSPAYCQQYQAWRKARKRRIKRETGR